MLEETTQALAHEHLPKLLELVWTQSYQEAERGSGYLSRTFPPRTLSSWVVAAEKEEEPAGRGVYLHCHDSR